MENGGYYEGSLQSLEIKSLTEMEFELTAHWQRSILLALQRGPLNVAHVATVISLNPPAFCLHKKSLPDVNEPAKANAMTCNSKYWSR
jgi:hypothetical protein